MCPLWDTIVDGQCCLTKGVRNTILTRGTSRSMHTDEQLRALYRSLAGIVTRPVAPAATGAANVRRFCEEFAVGIVSFKYSALVDS